MLFTHWDNYVIFYRMQRFSGREQCQLLKFEIAIGPYSSDFITDKSLYTVLQICNYHY